MEHNGTYFSADFIQSDNSSGTENILELFHKSSRITILNSYREISLSIINEYRHLQNCADV